VECLLLRLDADELSSVLLAGTEVLVCALSLDERDPVRSVSVARPQSLPESWLERRALRYRSSPNRSAVSPQDTRKPPSEANARQHGNTWSEP
jgi:hypothetical protein